jgi:hypothetical protein
MADDPLRRIVGREYREPKYSRAGTGSVRLELECGHHVVRKFSNEPRTHCRCPDCLYDQSEELQ